jgi:hypothetical protein
VKNQTIFLIFAFGVGGDEDNLYELHLYSIFSAVKSSAE